MDQMIDIKPTMKTIILSTFQQEYTSLKDFKHHKKIIYEERITVKDGIRLFDAELSYLGALANYSKYDRL